MAVSPWMAAEAKERRLLARTLVRTVVATRTMSAAEAVTTGDIAAQAQTTVSFRVNGKVAARMVEVGDHVTPGQVLGRLDPYEQRANLDAAQAALASAEALLAQAGVAYDRQKSLLAGGFTTRSNYDNAEQSLRSSQAALDSARAALGSATEQFSYAELKAGVDGIVLSRSLEVGQVVQGGQSVLVVAQDGPRDAVFDLQEALLAGSPGSELVKVSLQSDPAVTASGRVREVSPQVDPASGTVRVKVGLSTTPPAMGLGAVVVGRGRFEARPTIALPWSALYRWRGGPAVWVRDPGTGTVSPRGVSIERYAPDSIVVASGIEQGDEVVVAGVQFLRPGQSVTVTGEGR